ncbi:hypothetical protein F3F94_03365 [Bacteroides salyersiae]|uniref:Uncharacterized protein n=1 Tax=Bacteroides salyersiae TaxID=291644 RepID=A0A641MZU0_9BACE|nr:hypothetical protein F3F94_03365 [Bacteroides salyersiae]
MSERGVFRHFMPESVSTRSAYKMLTCIYLCRTLLFFAPYADFFPKKRSIIRVIAPSPLTLHAGPYPSRAR